MSSLDDLVHNRSGPRPALDPIVERFEEAWKRGVRPAIEDYLPPGGPERQAALIELAHADLDQRLKAGEAARVEDYLGRFPELAVDPGVLLDLVKAEYNQRRRDTPAPTLQEYCQRFPQFAEFLRDWIDASATVVDDSPRPPGWLPDAARSAGRIPARLGRYRVLAQLGSGSFGVVYRGYDDELRRDVAIKVPHRHLVSSPRDVEAYLAEARTVASLDHPNIVPVYDVGTTEGLCFVVSRFIEGSDLAERLRQGRLSFTQSAELVAVVAEALHHAHGKGLVHRDVKPSNLLLSTSGKPYVADFGVALQEGDFGRGMAFAGTPAYMSPEQARGEGHRVDGRSDLFSLGVVFYELLTGRRPFRGETVAEVLEQITQVEARPPRQVDDTIPRELERICLKALARRAIERYTTGRDLAEDLRCFLATHPGVPPPAGGGGFSSPTLVPAPVLSSSMDRQPVRIVPKGLRSFDAADADFFLQLLPGPRDREGLPQSIRFWKGRIEETDPDQTCPVGLIYGPSGCGKSSLIKAGLLPRLADHVSVVYVEATAAETESRLLKGLRKHCPDLPEGLSLVESLAALRRGRGLAAGKKVLLLIDQFEQWLHARPREEHTELVGALRQCDGGRVQCVVTVRDDFWMAATRFLEALEVSFLQGENSAAVDLFDLRHARRVLEAFGRALGPLPETGELRPEQEEFLDQATAGLAQEGKVISVRLALFAEMVKGRPWTSATLKAVGGTEGVGVTFLEETFSAPTAPPEHRLHQRAARAVLAALLPEQGTDIKGSMRSHEDLRAAAGYAQRPRDFEKLLRILDGELRLITPTDPEGSGSEVAQGSAGARRHYQLTHDYLVPALRQWLTRKQRETRRGRAALRLAERAASWNAKPENRHLPAWWEWLNIRLFTRPLDWTVAQRRMMRQATGYHLLRGLALAVLVVMATLTALHVRGQIIEQGKANHAAALVKRLLDAEIAQVPAIIPELEGYRPWADPLLQQENARARDDSREKLHTSLALLPVDGNQVAYLSGRLLNADPHEVPIIRDALLPHKRDLVPGLWTALEQSRKGPEQQRRRVSVRTSPGATPVLIAPLSSGLSDEEQRLRAAAALATYDPDNPSWEKVSAAVVEQLVSRDLIFFAVWIDAFRPVRARLVGPLCRVFREQQEHTGRRILATNILADYAADQPDLLADLLMDANEKQFALLFPKLEAWPERAVGPLERELGKQPDPGAEEGEKEQRAKRQANAAAALFQMGRPEYVWPLLRHRPDPRVRSYLIHRLGPSGADPQAIVKRLDEEKEISIRRALLLSLGEFSQDHFSAAERESLVGKVVQLYREDSDPGLHGAAEWLLRQWQQDKRLRQLNEEWTKDPRQQKAKLQQINQELAKAPGQAKPQWYVNGQGQTMVVIPGPVEFLMGVPPAQRMNNEMAQHRKRIGRSFAIAAKSVTVREYLGYNKGYPIDQRYAPTADCPVPGTSWYQAAGYCNWLSEQEGIPKNQQCYETDQAGQVTKLKENYLRLPGYRLPTEAEMEYATRAGSLTNRYFGETEELLDKYGWYLENSHNRSWPVGSKKPNDLGLFDMHGNVLNWCQERFRSDSQAQEGDPSEDRDDMPSINNQEGRAIRNGSFAHPASWARSAYRDYWVPTDRLNYFSFRPARTIR